MSDPLTTESKADLIRAFIHTDLLNRVGPPDFCSDDDLLTSGLVDSLGVMRLVAYLEDSFHCKIPMEEVTVENFQTCEAIVDYLQRAEAR